MTGISAFAVASRSFDDIILCAHALTTLLTQRKFTAFNEVLHGNAAYLPELNPQVVTRATGLMLETGYRQPPATFPFVNMLQAISVHPLLLEAALTAAASPLTHMATQVEWAQDFASIYKAISTHTGGSQTVTAQTVGLSMHTMLSAGKAIAFQRLYEGAQHIPAHKEAVAHTMQASVRALVANKKALYVCDLLPVLATCPELIPPTTHGLRQGIGDLLGRALPTEKERTGLEYVVELSAFAMAVTQIPQLVEACGKVKGVNPKEVEPMLATRFARAALVTDYDVWSTLLGAQAQRLIPQGLKANQGQPKPAG